MKLYTYEPAPNPQRLANFLKYKGIEIETQQIDMLAQSQIRNAGFQHAAQRSIAGKDQPRIGLALMKLGKGL